MQFFIMGAVPLIQDGKVFSKIASHARNQGHADGIQQRLKIKIPLDSQQQQQARPNASPKNRKVDGWSERKNYKKI